jgi:hypothetical protein
MKTLINLLVVCLLMASCSGRVKADLTQIPIINTVSSIKSKKATAIPLTDDKVFLISGTVKSNIYLLGKGCIELADTNVEDETILILTEHKYNIGDKVSLKISEKELISINDDGVDIYTEN